MKRVALLAVFVSTLVPLAARASAPPLLAEETVAAIAGELSGESAKRNLELLSRHHRTRGSSGYHSAAAYIVDRLRAYGLEDATILEYPADGRVFYGTQRSRPAWDAEFAELWELGKDGSRTRIASWDAMPMTLAQDSESAELTSELVDVGDGTSESDYDGKDVRGKIVLAAAQPGPVAAIAVARRGAAGIVSYAQNQRTAWWKENENLVRWGHLDTFAESKTFAFMISLGHARDYQARLARGEAIRLHAIVRAGQSPGAYEVATATIPGSDPVLRREEIVFSCHLDHPRPGANDNASGCVAILEVARMFSKLIEEKRLPQPGRTIRFVWPAEIEGTLAFLTGTPAIPSRIKAAIHLDMVGGGRETKAIFHVTRGPASLPSFVYDVAEAFGRFVNEESAALAMNGTAKYPLNAPEGGKEALQAEMVEFTMGSDHEVYSEGSFGVPSIYLNDWPDRYIHTNFDSVANIDPTKLRRAAFIAAASGWFLANMTGGDTGEVAELLKAGALRRMAMTLDRSKGLSEPEAANLSSFAISYERALAQSLLRFVDVPPVVDRDVEAFLGHLSLLVRPTSAFMTRDSRSTVYQRNPEVRGPMSVFGYDYFNDHYGEEKAREVRLLQYTGDRGSGGDYAYEALNLVDGKRDTRSIRDILSAVYGPIPEDVLLEYLEALESIDVIDRVEP